MNSILLIVVIMIGLIVFAVANIRCIIFMFKIGIPGIMRAHRIAEKH